MYEPGEMFPIKVTRCREEVTATRRQHRSLSPASSDRLTPLICWRVMGSARSVQWATRAPGVMSRLGVLVGGARLLIGQLIRRGTQYLLSCNDRHRTDTCWLKSLDHAQLSRQCLTAYVKYNLEKYEDELISLRITSSKIIWYIMLNRKTSL